MTNDPFHERGQAMEDWFFKNVDEKLLAKMRAEMQEKEAKAALAKATGITDDAVLAALVEHRISPETLLALSFIPLIAVAWSDGALDPNEQKAIERAMSDEGIAAGSTPFQLIQHWLTKQPPADLIETWQSYVGSLKQRMEPDAFERMRGHVLDRAAKIAQAAGGFLGLGSKISANEQEVLNKLKQSL